MKKLLPLLLFLAFLLPHSSEAAIAFDNSTSTVKGNNTSPLLMNLAVGSGSNRMLIVCVHTYDTSPAGSDLVTSVTYNSVTMNRLGDRVFGTQQRIYMYYLANPDSGTNVITVNTSSASEFGLFFGTAASYTGVKQTSFADASASSSLATNADSVGTVTTVADNAWLVQCTSSDDNASATAGANTTVRSSNPGVSPQRHSIADSNGAKTPPGSYSLTIDVSATTAASGNIIASMAPGSSAPPLWPFFFMSIGPIIPRRKLLAITSSL